MAAPGGLGALTFALGFGLERKPLRDRWRLHVRCCPEVIGHLRGHPHAVGSTLAIVGTAGVRCDALKQRQSLFGAVKIDCLEASEPCEALQHGALHRH